MLKSTMVTALAVLAPLAFASGASAQVPASPDRPAKTGAEARTTGTASQRAASRVASRAEARAMPAPSPSTKGIRDANGRRSMASAAARGPLAATLEAGPAVPAKGLAKGSAKGSAQAGRMADRMSSLDGVIPTLSAPNPETAAAGPLAEIIEQARLELRSTRDGAALRPAPSKPAGKEGNGGAKH